MAASAERTAEACRYVLRHNASNGDIFCQELHDQLHVLYTCEIEGSPVVAFKVHTDQGLTNLFGFVHGGAISTIAAIHSRLALAVDDKYWKRSGRETNEQDLKAFLASMGTSRGLNVQILQAVPLNADLTVKCTVLNSTKTNSYVSVEILGPTGKLLAVANHDMMKQQPAAKL